MMPTPTMPMRRSVSVAFWERFIRTPSVATPGKLS
jgi:hypothetical protein